MQLKIWHSSKYLPLDNFTGSWSPDNMQRVFERFSQELNDPTVLIDLLTACTEIANDDLEEAAAVCPYGFDIIIAGVASVLSNRRNSAHSVVKFDYADPNEGDV